MCVVQGLGSSDSPHRPRLPYYITPHVGVGENLGYPAFRVTVTVDEVVKRALRHDQR